MKKKELNLKQLIESYGFSRNSLKYLLPGSAIQQYIGCPMIRVFMNEEKPTEIGSNWEVVYLNSVKKTDSSELVLISYKTDKGEEKEIKTLPEGMYIIKDGDVIKQFSMFIPQSLHWKMLEDEILNFRVKDLYKTRKTLEFNELDSISKKVGDEKDYVLKYSRNIGAAVKLETGEYLWIRITSLMLIHDSGKTWSLILGDNKNTFNFKIEEGDEEYNFLDNLGKFKILDLSD